MTQDPPSATKSLLRPTVAEFEMQVVAQASQLIESSNASLTQSALIEPPAPTIGLTWPWSDNKTIKKITGEHQS